MVDDDDVRRHALALPGAEAGTSWGTASYKVGGKLFARMLEDGKSVVVKVDLHQRAELVSAEPHVFSVTAHYEKWPMVIVTLDAIDADELREVLTDAWRLSAPRRQVVAYDDASPAKPGEPC